MGALLQFRRLIRLRNRKPVGTTDGHVQLSRAVGAGRRGHGRQRRPAGSAGPGRPARRCPTLAAKRPCRGLLHGDRRTVHTQAGTSPHPTDRKRHPRASQPHGQVTSDEAGPGSSRDPLVAALAAAVDGHRVRRVPLQVLRAAFAAPRPDRCDQQRLPRASGRGADVNSSATARSSCRKFTAAVREATCSRRFRPGSNGPRHRARLPPARPARVWRPELAAAAALASSAADFDVLERVDDFLRRGGGARRPIVPHRERSVELFGHEKRLDALIRRTACSPPAPSRWTCCAATRPHCR